MQQKALQLSAAFLLIAFTVSICDCSNGWGQDSEPPTPPRPRRISAPTAPPEVEAEITTAGDAKAEQKDREEKFAQYMTGASLKGRFSIMGRGDKMPEETYTITKCEKLPKDNLYRFTARIQYGDIDTELPMEIPVEWAGDTPVISLTNMWIPGLGTFSARVLIYKETYAGTWIHDEVGGQMIGVIIREKAASQTEETPTTPTEAPNDTTKKPK